MNIYLMSFLAILSIIIVVYMLIKKMDIKITLFAVGILLMYAALLTGGDIAIKDFKSTGLALFDPILAIIMSFKSTLSRAGLIILMLGGYTSYMSEIGANKVTIYSLTKPLNKFKSPYILVPVVFLVGNLLSLVIPSASTLAIILLATLYPVLKSSGMSTLTAAALIATTATVMPTPLGGDNVAIASELAKTAQFANITATEYVFSYHAIVSIPTLIFAAIIHYLWQKHEDKKDILNKSVEKDIDNGKVEIITGTRLYKIVYTLLPILPIILLLTTYILKIKVNITVELATIVSFIVAVICELIKNKNVSEVLKKTELFFVGMGNSIGVVALLVAAGVFVTGLKSIGIISQLQSFMVGMSGSNLGFVLPLILLAFTVLIVLLSGSGVALFYAMVPLMVPLATAAAINPLAVTLTMGLGGNLLRSVSPVSAVIVIVAGSVKENPIKIVRRTSVPMILSLVFMFVLTMIMYL